jgi:hypothetical protein
MAHTVSQSTKLLKSTKAREQCGDVDDRICRTHIPVYQHVRLSASGRADSSSKCKGS